MWWGEQYVGWLAVVQLAVMVQVEGVNVIAVKAVAETQIGSVLLMKLCMVACMK